MKIHLISIGGAIMHNLAISLNLKGHKVSGSDDEIFEPAKSRLASVGLLPLSDGWNPDLITPDLDAIILGMHAHSDNPELIKAQKLNLKIYSFPEFIFMNSSNKTRIAVAGSHGKTTITSMIMTVLRSQGVKFDYLVGSSVKGFEHSLKLTEDSPNIVIEADEYLSSAINPEPKFLWYKPQIALISGIAWDHMNVFPTFEIYIHQFELFIESMPEKAVLIYDESDLILKGIVEKYNHIIKKPYHYPEFLTENNQYYLVNEGCKTALKINGKHNLLNSEGARLVCEEMGISRSAFSQAISSFDGAGKRLEFLYEKDNFIAFKDFAHAPSKVKATIEGIKDQYENRKVIACLELHTYSSLNKNFLPQYKGAMNNADVAVLYINEEAVKMKRLQMLSEKEIIEAFDNPKLVVSFDKVQLEQFLLEQNFSNSVLLLMSSGNFGGLNLLSIASKDKSKN